MSVLDGILHTFSNLIFRLLSYIYFQERIVFYHSNCHGINFAKRYNIIEKNVVHFNVESVNFLDIAVSNRTF